jgi:hypothetical protein
MSLSAVMMAACQPPVTAVAMKMILTFTTEQLAAMLARFCTTIRANQPRPEGFEHRRRRHVHLPADPSRIPAYLRRHCLSLRLQSRFDAQALHRWQEGVR